MGQANERARLHKNLEDLEFNNIKVICAKILNVCKSQFLVIHYNIFPYNKNILSFLIEIKHFQ